MQKDEIDQLGKVMSLDEARERRHYIDLANSDWGWQQTKASFALEGIELDDRDAERTGRFIAGVITLEQGIDEILRELALTASD